MAVFVASKQGVLICAPGTSLSAGRAVSPLVALLLRGLTCPAAPAGVFVPSAPINRFYPWIYLTKNNLLENSHF